MPMSDLEQVTVIRGAKVVTNQGVMAAGAVRLQGSRILDIRSSDSAPFKDGDTVMDASGCWLLPGFIDLHVHGGNGAEFMDGTREAFARIARFHARYGTTAMLATTVTAPLKRLEHIMAVARDYVQQPDPQGAWMAGVHLEGPFLNPKRAGAQQAAHMVLPDPDWVTGITERFPGLLRLMTLAPELPGSLNLIRLLADRGITASCGHTDASYEQTMAAADAGLTHAAHVFNGMTGLHHRNPGVVGAILEEERIVAEVIADGHHVHPAAIRLLARCKGSHGLVLITDAISAAGLPDGAYRLGELDVTVKEGVARLTRGGNLAGSTLTMLEAFRYAVKTVGLSIPEASRMASANPARQIGLDRITGAIEPGKRADLVLLDGDLNIRQVWIGGRSILCEKGDITPSSY